MNGFEPLRRRVIDYTAAGQWQEVYVGPIEECEEYRLKAENEKLREFAKYVLLCSEGDLRCKACPFHANREDGPYVLCGARKAARSLGVEVEE